MYNGDVFGDEGRKVLNVCVKVKIYGKLELRRYDREVTMFRLMDCYVFVYDFLVYLSFYIDQFTFLKDLEFVDYIKSEKIIYNIVDIYDIFVKFDEKSYVDKYFREGFGFEKLRVLIDKRREDIEREYKEVRNNLEERFKYFWIVVQRRVRDCFVGKFLRDKRLVMVGNMKLYNVFYNIKDVYDVVVFMDERFFCEEYLIF